MKPPQVSVVIATYGRPAVLRCALVSLREQTFSDWEGIVVGDGCTDDSEAVVSSLGDNRLRWHNLPRNVGNQFAPNNAGVALARAPLIAFLNHDDLWFSDHLERALAVVQEPGVDLCFSLVVSLRRDESCHLIGASGSGRYDPRLPPQPASSWILRRELVARVGPWSPPKASFTIPSQDWLFRAHRAGAVMVANPHLGVIALQTGDRPGCYLETDAAEHERLLARMRQDARWREHLLSRAAMEVAGRYRQAEVWRRVYDVFLGIWFAIARCCGWHPDGLRNLIKYRKKGGMVEYLQRLRGLTRPEKTTTEAGKSLP